MNKKNVKFVYILLNKPSGYVSALKDNVSPTVISLIKEKIPHLHIVGRLDKDTTGLIMLTNDGQYTHKTTSAKHHRPKVYLVKLAFDLKEEDIYQIQKGMQIDHGQTQLKPGEIKMISSREIELTIFEGKFHQVKKMFFALNNKVISLHRVVFDIYDLRDYNLMPGEYIYI